MEIREVHYEFSLYRADPLEISFTHLNRKPPPFQINLGLFLYQLQRVPASTPCNQFLAPELLTIADKYLHPSTDPWLVKLIVDNLLGFLKPEQINDQRILTNLLVCLSELLKKLECNELEILLQDPVIQQSLTIRSATLLHAQGYSTGTPRTVKSKSKDVNGTQMATSSSSSLSSSENYNQGETNSSILTKYNQLVQQRNQRSASLPGRTLHDYDIKGGDGYNKQTTNSLLRLIESETQSQELILLSMRLIVNTLSDQSPTNYCRDYQLCAIISGALDQWQSSSSTNNSHGDQCLAAHRRRFWASLLAVAVVESFAVRTVVPRRTLKGLVAVLDGVLSVGITRLRNNDSLDFTWTFLVVYLINNSLQASASPRDKVNQSDLLNKFSEIEPDIRRITGKLLTNSDRKTIHRQNGLKVLSLLVNCLENYKRSLKVSSTDSNRKPRTTSSIHHQPILGSYRRFDCITEQCLWGLLPLIERRSDKVKILNVIAKVGLCCCSANRTNLSVLWGFTLDDPSLVSICLRVLRHCVYDLWICHGNACRLCAERLDGLQNELLCFYGNAISKNALKRPLLHHLLISVRRIPFSVQMRLVLEILWREFSQACDAPQQSGSVNDTPLRYCLMIFGRTLQCNGEMVKMFMTDASVEMLIKCRSKWPALTPFVCEIFLRALEKSRQLDAELVDKMLADIVTSCVQDTHLVVLFLGSRVRGRKLLLSGFEEDETEEEPNEFHGEHQMSFGVDIRAFRAGDLEDVLQRTVALWRILGQVMSLSEEEIDEYLEQHFLTKANVFHVICLAIVFVLDVESDGGTKEENSNKEEDCSLKMTMKEIIENMDRFLLERDCDKKVFILRHQKDDGAKVQATAIDQSDVNDISYAYRQVPVLFSTAALDADAYSFDQVISKRDRRTMGPYSCDILLDFWAEKEACLETCAETKVKSEERKEVLKDKRDSLSLVESVFNTVKETTGRLIHHYVGDHWGGSEEEKPKNPGAQMRKLRDELAKVKITADLRMRVGQLLDAALTVFVVMHSGEEFGEY